MNRPAPVEDCIPMVSNVKFLEDVSVQLIGHDADDMNVIEAAKVSSSGKIDLEDLENTDPERFINVLMKHRHGSPFEHATFRFFIEAPIFVVREWQRHRIGSFNEMSGRYKNMEPKFYIPSNDRPVINQGTSMRPKFELTEYSPGEIDKVKAAIRASSLTGWNLYSNLLNDGVAKEVARMVLPLNVYTQMHWTVNARSLMNFISLRVESDESRVKSYPQYEIQLGARKVEECFAELMPVTHKTFLANGRVAP